MFRAPARIALAAALVRCAGGDDGCAKQEHRDGGQPSGPTSVRIERTYTLLNASPFQMTGDAASAQKLYAALQALSPDSGQTACPGDAGVHYTITVMDGSKQLTKATAIYGGCRVVLMTVTRTAAPARPGRRSGPRCSTPSARMASPTQGSGSSGRRVLTT